MSKFVRFTLPVIVWMILIFLLSSRQSVSVSEQFALNFIFFKLLHVFEYAVLYLLLVRALHNGAPEGKMARDTLRIAVAAALLYAVTDEIHQTFVPTREGTVRDVFIDAIGISLMYVYCMRGGRLVRRLLT